MGRRRTGRRAAGRVRAPPRCHRQARGCARAPSRAVTSADGGAARRRGLPPARRRERGHHRRLRRRAPRPPGRHRRGAAAGRRARAARAPSSPSTATRPGRAPGVGAPAAHRPRAEARAAGRHRLDRSLVISFDEARAKEPAEDFVREVLVGCLGAQAVIVGEDFHFGHQRRGNVDAARGRWAPSSASRSRASRSSTPTARAAGDGEQVSSTAIRHALVDGRPRRAPTRMLGRPHEVRGLVAHGDERGRELGFPTANVAVPGDILLPADGIYAGWYERPDGAVQPAASRSAAADLLRGGPRQPPRGPPPRLRRRPLRRARPGAVRGPPARRGEVRPSRPWSSRSSATATRPEPRSGLAR